MSNPHAIVQFSTDGIVSLEPLDLDIGEELGQWEHKLIEKGIYLHSGVYSYVDIEEDKDVTKTRGMNPDYSNEENEEPEPENVTALIDNKKEVGMRELLLQKALPAWRAAADSTNQETWPQIEFLQRIFVTAGSAVAGADRFKLIGRWTRKPRKVNVHEAGLKRALNWLRPELYFSTASTEGYEGREADRCHELVPTVPAFNVEGAYTTPSKSSRPKWLELDGEIVFENVFADDEVYETEEIMETM